MRRVLDIIFLIIVVTVGYQYRHEIRAGALVVGERTGIIEPCTRPITYSIGDFDERFGITEATLLQNIRKAENLWETAANRNLFEYSPTGSLAINLIYDYRQASTQKLNTLENSLDTAQARYDSLKLQYTNLKLKVNAERNELQAMIRRYESGKKASREEVAAIQEKQASVNAQIETLNGLATKLNTLAKELNVTVDSYNTISSSVGEAFNEGEYIYDAEGERINIYQYSNGTKLDRVLAHEFGHALKLDHVENAQSIMYYLNSGTVFELTQEDVSELTEVCKL
jgi:hypothetical protein